MPRPSHRTALALLFVSTVAVACSDSATAPATEPHAARGRATPSGEATSPEWQAEARTLVATNTLSTLAAVRVYAALSVAQYLAVVDADGHFDVEGALPEHGRGAGGRRLVEARRGAVAGASAEVLTYFFPGAAADLAKRVKAAASAPGGAHPHFTRGLAIGRRAGATLVERAKRDRFTAPWTNTIPVGAGVWIPARTGTPVGATFPDVTPYLLASNDQFRPGPPPTFGSAAFVAARDEIRSLVLARTPEQRASAIYWNFPNGTYTPPGYWNAVAGTYIGSHALNERAATHTFALLHAAVFDAFVGCWDAKYEYLTLRPSQADPSITPGLAFALPNHPSYPAGHACGSNAAATVLRHLFPDHTAEVNAWAADAGLSRMYAGIHYRFDIVAGQELGTAVAEWAIGVDERTGLLAALR